MSSFPPVDEISYEFFRASGPGGQNVNKVSTAVRLRFDVRRSSSLSEAAKARLRHLAGRKVTDDGVLVIEARRFRTQDQNRRDADARLTRLLAAARRPPRPRKATKPSAASRRVRLESKKRRGRAKRLRQAPRDLD
ncbi:MAG TPA: alternative ribosome rescue aminoacyl-tRNA hydrolase ArfB [Anaerolineales bacterium]|nr:alternative ribosome rescue aminoacyl-tRNA hydrolase ArfB [Anaerolineales bacterium]